MDNVVTVSGPFPYSPTVQYCDLGAHRLRDDQLWWRVTDISRGLPEGKGAACARHVVQVQAVSGTGRLYQVGGPFDTERTNWPRGPHLWMDDSDIPVRLAIFLTDPSPQEIAAVDTGKARFGWTEQGVNGFLLYKYGDAPWSDAPFNPQRLGSPFGLQPLPRGTHTRVGTFLVHADTGRIAAMRMFTWPAYFFNHVIASVHRVKILPCNETAAPIAQQDFYRRYPDSPSLYRLTRTLPPVATCLGGQPEDRPH